MSSSNCNCRELLHTYSIIEKNLIRDIDTLQYERHQMIQSYENQLHELQKALENSKITQTNKIKLLSKEIVNEKVAKHILENKLKLLEGNLQHNTLKNKAERNSDVQQNIPSIFEIKSHIINLEKLMKNFHSKIPTALAHKETEILNQLSTIVSSINSIRLVETEVESNTNR